MSDQQQNGTAAAPQFKDDELVLFVRLLKKTGEFQCIFPDLMTALALHKISGEYLESQVRQMFQQPQQITVPGLSLPTLDKIRGRT